jgi:hypothetical protein
LSRTSWLEALALVAIALCTGLVVRALAVWLRDSGPARDGVSLKGNGALIVLPVAVVALVVVEVEAARRRSWLGMLWNQQPCSPACLWSRAASSDVQPEEFYGRQT